MNNGRDHDALAERIILDLRNILQKRVEAIEFDIIHVDKQLVNKSPVVQLDHRVGLESWCVKHVYSYAYKRFKKYKQRRQNLSELEVRPEKLSSLNGWTTILLFINPDLGSAWNSRKELVTSDSTNVEKELLFSESVLSRKPKSPDNFAYRQWLMRKLCNQGSDMDYDEAIQNELRVSLHTASRYQRNYHAWSHRVWLANSFYSDRCDMIEMDLCLTKNWVETHISDYSGWSYRQHLMTCMWNISLKEDTLVKKVELLMFGELDLLNSSSTLYRDRESLFYHRRFILKAIAEWFSPRVASLQKSEINFIEENLSCAYRNSSHNNWHLELISRHVRWIKTALKWDLDPEKCG
ncbi:Protein prenyltransferase alpha subunit repeat-containing protein 1 [Halotydeus destructor]|nr:Protein prenyltransferase alpha subunit repeat-containing protein 1 [Halotydeus destructor]